MAKVTRIHKQLAEIARQVSNSRFRTANLLRPEKRQARLETLRIRQGRLWNGQSDLFSHLIDLKLYAKNSLRN